MSSVFPGWQQFAVHQRRPQSGCIPTGYEMILRSVGAQNVNLATFQDDFDLDRNLKDGETPRNNFESVADAVRKKYSDVCFRRVGFDQGSEELEFVEKRLANRQPVLVSIANKPFGGQGWHIMPVVDATDNELVLLKAVDADGTPETCVLWKEQFVRIHDNYEGGDDVAYRETV